MVLARSPAPAGTFLREVKRRLDEARSPVHLVALATSLPVGVLLGNGVGARRIPLGCVAAIASATHSDPRSLKRLWAEEYEPLIAARLVPRQVDGIWIDVLGPPL
jgi:hypothetical protein